MMFYTDKWVFIHIPKTSGKNILNECKKAIPSLQVPWIDTPNPSSQNYVRHNPIWWWDQKYDLSQRDFYTVVRNPYFRILSLWNYCVNTGLTEKKYSFEKFLIEKPPLDILFDLTKNHGRSAEQRGIVYDIHDSQVQFIDDRVETFKLEEDLNILENKIGVKFSHSHKNSTQYNKPYRYFYTDNLQELVYNRYKDDFERFNYSVDL